jgi:hypothetical protein
VVASINHQSINFKDDGSYRIVLSRRPPPAAAPAAAPGDNNNDNGDNDVATAAGQNWLQLTADSVSIVTRHYFESDPPVGRTPGAAACALSIATRAPQPPPRLPLSDSESARRLRAVANFVRAHSLSMPQVGGVGGEVGR